MNNLNKYDWNLLPLLQNKTIEQWKKEIIEHYEIIFSLKGKITNSIDNLKEFLDHSKKSSIIVSKIGCYLHNLENVDLSNTEISKLVNDFDLFLYPWGIKLSFVSNELKDNVEKILNMLDEETAIYKKSFERLKRRKKHKISNREEKLLSVLSNALGNSDEIFSKLTNVDFSFGEVEDSQGVKYKLTQGTASKLLRDKDIVLRKNSYFAFWKEYKKHENTLSATYYANLCETSAFSKIYKYKSSLEAALFSDNVTPKFYNFALNQIAKNSKLLLKWRKILVNKTGISNPKPWDWNTEIFSPIDKKYEINDSQRIIKDALSILGSDYVAKLDKAFENNWIDWLPKDSKRSGAYSYGVWEGNPYILLNWNGKYLDLSTLAHELGHSMHTLYSNENQDYEYHDYPIFLAEVASTTNELLLVEYLLKHEENPQMRAYILENAIREIIGTIYRQALFADFEQIVHNKVDQNEPITLDVFKNICKELYPKYFPKLKTETYEDEFENLWGLYVPHFYSDFYVYKYATAMISAISFTNKILNGNKGDVENYLSFLKMGSSEWPIDALKKSGVDLLDKKTYDEAFELLEHYLCELEKLLN
ncbi:hypothetical protein ASO20_01810 [Mycoplasma sp. (ex Biomphalaria glabrata)]|uniref:oligoendopeptidase F n=1 Tax=Mycoplasma sp. (ex Biomphalaria glabrata) TaxID=1749074 RepID=UPI00073A5819|nr:oligoendopeptidase F [Mycoplasma sp. (ex Biomphalaria glabrata)]ALV23383.1 hypothetical protein ASO20_01810 [Mycoplasma sp. (ex Biomphalaria glabrata)]